MREEVRAAILFIGIIVAFATVNAQEYIHVDYDWEGDGDDFYESEFTKPHGDSEGCYACHAFKKMEPGGPSRMCEDCHLSTEVYPNAAGPVKTSENPDTGFNLNEDYTQATLVYQHYYGASVNVPNQRYEYDGVTSSTCSGFNPETGQGTCHGVSIQNSEDGKYSFNFSKPVDKKCLPYRWVTTQGFPETVDCLYCHMHDDAAIRKAWGNPSKLTDHHDSTTKEDCYSCHVEGGGTPSSFHSVKIKLAEGQEETPSPALGGEPAPSLLLLQEGRNELTTNLYRKIIFEKDLRYKSFFMSHRTLIGPLLMLGKYPKPTNPDAVRALAKPIEKIYGDVYEIAASGALEKYGSADTVVIARGDLPVDSMAAIAYAKAKKSPILLVEPGEIPPATLDAISKLKTEEIIIVGGPEAVSESVEKGLAGKVKRIYGANRVETAVELAKEAQPDTVVITDAIHPSIDATLISYLFDAPLLYVNPGDIPQSVKEYLSQRKTTSNGSIRVVVLGVNQELIPEIDDLI